VSDSAVTETSRPAEATSVVDSPTVTVLLGDLTFSLPSSFKFHADGFASSGEAVDDFYGNVPLGSACTHGCGLPSFSPLPAGGIVVSFGVLSGIGAGGRFPGEPAPNTTIAGHDAVFAADKPGNCGGDETIAVRFPVLSEQDYMVRACLYGPDLAVAEQTIESILASAEVTGP